ncbi:MAG TPA: hypothetical protein VL501_07650, partial [Pyrinomonadaceae bacterium]|nr:hypothetical protein [Pyrinomonadaceae bacterium]
AIADTLRVEAQVIDAGRQPVHVVYGGAHLFSHETPAKLGRLALKAIAEYCPEPQYLAAIFGIEDNICNSVYEKIVAKLTTEPVEDLRIDFEDGYGYRSDQEEDSHAESAAQHVVAGMSNNSLPPFLGIRIKPFSRESHSRAIRTLDIFLTSLIKDAGGKLPANFVITLPKIVSAEQVSALARVVAALESRLSLPAGVLRVELMIETPQSILTPKGEFALPTLVDAAGGRCVAAHFGAYDYTASLGIASEYQDMLSQACDFARNVMKVSLSETGIRVSDGATNVMPVPPHRGKELTPEQKRENLDTVRSAWRLHYAHCRHSLANGFYQGWDLHPAQLVSRYAAIYAFFLEGLPAASERLQNFIDKAAQATLVGNVFDDAATGQGLLNYFVRAVGCGAITDEEALRHSGLSLDELRSGSFQKILDRRSSNS